MNNDLVKSFQGIVEKVDPVLFPVTNGEKINIGSYSIRPCNRGGYLIKSYKTNAIVAETYSKAAAVAIAKTLSKNKNYLKKILELDHVIEKHQVDCMFYKYTMKKTNNPVKYETTAYRYDISKQKTREARAKINKFIL